METAILQGREIAIREVLKKVKTMKSIVIWLPAAPPSVVSSVYADRLQVFVSFQLVLI
jgi:hypothetical protein